MLLKTLDCKKEEDRNWFKTDRIYFIYNIFTYIYQFMIISHVTSKQLNSRRAVITELQQELGRFMSMLSSTIGLTENKSCPLSPPH